MLKPYLKWVAKFVLLFIQENTLLYFKNVSLRAIAIFPKTCILQNK